MHISFDNLTELREFMDFAGFVPRNEIRLIAQVDDAVTTAMREQLVTDFVNANTPQTASGETLDALVAQPAVEPEKATRKRRTKAEMEAARAAEGEQGNANAPEVATGAALTESENVPASESAAIPTDDTAAAAQSPHSDDNPFAARADDAATQAILNAPTGQAATLAGIAAMQGAMGTAEDAPAIDVTEFVNSRTAEILAGSPELKAVAHLKKCQEAIATLGKARYDESFDLAGLPKTIATFKAPEIARHQAALEYLQLTA